MGSPTRGADCRPPHEVMVTGFWIGTHEVTNAQFAQFRIRPRPATSLGDNQPVANVSWFEAEAYCRWLSKKEKKVYRLPTEAEWEYAARGGLAQQDFAWGNQKPQQSDDLLLTTKPVGSNSPNRYGLYGLSGNVTEYVSDWYDENYYARSPARDPIGPVIPPLHRMKVARDHTYAVMFPFVAQRLAYFPRMRTDASGFRVVMGALPPAAQQSLRSASTARPEVIPARITDPAVRAALKDSPDAAMVVAINRGDAGAIRVLLAQGASVHTREEDPGTSVLTYAVYSNEMSFLREVMSYRPDPNVRDNYGQTPLMAAVDGMDLDIVRYLLRHGADVNASDQWGLTPLMRAVKRGHVDVLPLLLKSGAKLDLVDGLEKTALMYAEELKDKEAAQLLRQAVRKR